MNGTLSQSSLLKAACNMTSVSWTYCRQCRPPVNSAHGQSLTMWNVIIETSPHELLSLTNRPPKFSGGTIAVLWCVKTIQQKPLASGQIMIQVITVTQWSYPPPNNGPLVMLLSNDTDSETITPKWLVKIQVSRRLKNAITECCIALSTSAVPNSSHCQIALKGAI